ncbi:hypothetical protein NDU88_004941 [Pleurodeles waltl]|uniref:Uncharacterized protein n=1 Tax=Pleurodeles waltl TaxID=8319 RepID=A0AAV7TSY4_PLEWA|nr:hypothetical protein NDU88_004941 [Pleurodeles waltl]
MLLEELRTGLCNKSDEYILMFSGLCPGPEESPPGGSPERERVAEHSLKSGCGKDKAFLSDREARAAADLWHPRLTKTPLGPATPEKQHCERRPEEYRLVLTNPPPP